MKLINRTTFFALAFTLAVATIFTVGLLNMPTTQAHGPDNNQGSHPNHHNSLPYEAGSRCVNTRWANNPHDGYTHAAYTQGPQNGTHPVRGVTANPRSDRGTWAVGIGWKAPRYGTEADAPDGKKTYACQPYTYIIQRSLGNGAWTDFESSRRNPATVRSNKKSSVYGPNASYSTDDFRDGQPASRTTVRYRVCGRLESEENDGTTYRSCVTSNTIQVGNSVWNPIFTTSDYGTRTVSENSTTIGIPVSANPPPPDDFTSNAQRRTSVTMEISPHPTQGTGCPSDSIPSQTAEITFDGNGDGTFQMTNPKEQDSTFTDDCRFRYGTSGRTKHSTLYVKEDDQWPLTLRADPSSMDSANATGGTVTGNVLIELTGDCPTLAQVEVPVRTTAYGQVDADDFTIQDVASIGANDCSESAVRVKWTLEEETNTISTSHGTLEVQIDSANAVNTQHGSNAAVAMSFAHIEFEDTRTTIGFEHKNHSIAAEETVTIQLTPPCASGTTGAQVDTPYEIRTNETPSKVLVSTQNGKAQYVPSANCFAGPIQYTPLRENAGKHLTVEIMGRPVNTADTRILTRNKKATIYVSADATTLVLSPSSISLTEGGQDQDIRVKLSAEPTSNVTVSFESDSKLTAANGNPGQNESDPLSFTNSNWNTYQTITVSPQQDSDSEDDQGEIELNAISQDTRYADETASLNYTITDDGAIEPLEFTYFPRPVLIPDTDGNTDVPNGHEDDAYVRVTANFPARGSESCYVKYVYLAIKGQDLVNHYGYEMTDNILDNFPLVVPYGNPRYWNVAQKSGYKEYTIPTWPGLTFQHYDDGIQDSVLIYHDLTPGDAREGRIQSYAIGNLTNCNGKNYWMDVVDLPPDDSTPTLDPNRKYGPYHRVNFPVE